MVNMQTMTHDFWKDNIKCFELHTKMWQTTENFIAILNRMRTNNQICDDLTYINLSCMRPASIERYLGHTMFVWAHSNYIGFVSKRPMHAYVLKTLWELWFLGLSEPHQAPTFEFGSWSATTLKEDEAWSRGTRGEEDGGSVSGGWEYLAIVDGLAQL